MSQRALGRQFFHGSPHEFAPGDEILPPVQTGVPLNKGDSHPDHVYVTPHEVEPRGQLRNDPNAPKHMPGLSKYTTKGAVVKRRLDPKEWQ